MEKGHTSIFAFIGHVKWKHHRAKERAKLLKHLPCRPKDMNRNLRTYVLKRMSIVACACNPSTREMETGSLASQPSILREVQASGDSVSQGNVGEVWGMTPEAVLWPPKCTCTHRHTCTPCAHQHPRTPAHPCYRPARPLHSFAQEQVPYHQGPSSCVRRTLAKDSTFFHTRSAFPRNPQWRDLFVRHQVLLVQTTQLISFLPSARLQRPQRCLEK